ncbi:methyltransferase domain-containing protein [Halalkalicoccus sp. NIPERK01]|uniref:methyltransferase domain-containing protein n=1 Tax=Halalkalicoccus sp. NIPERK01 TaxID=3053469 RepID=UPI00256F1975|nr:methyltransferase domain-containing protein [Halalkalicoccus sp. NIPERK01]MDL5362230.1 methyltransferase domain-containing protein [Halalkalicoccus sp. NIPERK01]
MANSLDVERLERAVKNVYRDVAEAPTEEYHFEMGRPLAERLGYPSEDLDRIPGAALESFAGVGYHFDLAAIEEGEDVLDLGSGSGTDAFVAALHVGEAGSVTGLDMTDEQLRKARGLRDEAGLDAVSFEKGYIEDLPFEDGSFDVVISNGVINLSAEKRRVFEEANRVLVSGGRLALSDIISEKRMPESIKTDADLWAACIGGAEQIDRYTTMVETAGFEVLDVRENTKYEFVSDQAANACRKYGVKSVSLGARK